MNQYFQLKDQITDYLYNMNNYSFDKVIQMMRSELQSIGVIDAPDGYMVWKSPDNMFIFEIERLNNVFITKPNDPQYTNIMRIKNNIGILVTEIRFSEYGCISILENIATFCETHFDEGCPNYDSITVFATTPDSSMSSTIMNLEFSNTRKDLLKIGFVNYNYHYQQMKELLHIVITYQQLIDFCFILFFQCIIDIDIDEMAMNGYGDELYIIENFVYGGVEPSNYNISQKQQNYYVPVQFNENPQISQNQSSQSSTSIKLDTSATLKSKVKLGLYKQGATKQ